MSDTILVQAQNIYSQQTHNKRLTWLVMSVMVIFLTFLAYGFDQAFFWRVYERTGIPFATIGAAIGSIVFAFVSLRSGATRVLNSAQAVPASSLIPEEKQLMNVVREISLAAGLPTPRVYIIPDEDPNAFATGRDPNNSFIAVTRGLLQTLTREELQGVVAHEMSHIRYYDIRLMTFVAAFVGAAVILSDLAGRTMWYQTARGGRSSSSSRRDGSSNMIFLAIWLITIIFAPLIVRIMAMMISRKREYLADASAAELTRNPLALAKALEKIDAASAPTNSIQKGVAHLCIADPLGRSANEKEGFWYDVFATHPPTKKRIMLLHSMAYQYMPAAVSQHTDASR